MDKLSGEIRARLQEAAKAGGARPRPAPGAKGDLQVGTLQQAKVRLSQAIKILISKELTELLTQTERMTLQRLFGTVKWEGWYQCSQAIQVARDRTELLVSLKRIKHGVHRKLHKAWVVAEANRTKTKIQDLIEKRETDPKKYFAALRRSQPQLRGTSVKVETGEGFTATTSEPEQVRTEVRRVWALMFEAADPGQVAEDKSCKACPWFPRPPEA